MEENGVLYVVATPIGNLEDITFRALKVLEAVDLIAAEDTREAQKLLFHFQLKAKGRLVSYYRDNEDRRVKMLLDRMKSGDDVALVSSRGTPGISDPAYLLVRAAFQEGIKVVPIPGPCAMVAGLSVSGLPTDRFTFFGFLPRKTSKRKRVLEELKESKMTSIIYESPHRVTKTLADLLNVVGNREMTVCRELTKKFEEIEFGTLAGINSKLQIPNSKKPRGEFVIILNGREKNDKNTG